FDINQESDGHTLLTLAANQESVAAVDWLVDHGVDLDCQDRNGLTALMNACAGKKKGSQIAIRLIDAGCDVLVRRAKDGMSALEFAAKTAEPEVVRRLVPPSFPSSAWERPRVAPSQISCRVRRVAWNDECRMTST
ncbi:MAG: ankyrin repeat domain-containing protein, partial [Planctomycetaceae bacterium]|nr:ankyrin repeat domain-containing protein [Planctomycetaceae bacterium]